MYSDIRNPKTGRNFSINSKSGLNILRNYLSSILRGGSDLTTTTTPPTALTRESAQLATLGVPPWMEGRARREKERDLYANRTLCIPPPTSPDAWKTKYQSAKDSDVRVAEIAAAAKAGAEGRELEAGASEEAQKIHALATKAREEREDRHRDDADQQWHRETEEWVMRTSWALGMGYFIASMYFGL